jgi:hypothetical protein
MEKSGGLDQKEAVVYKLKVLSAHIIFREAGIGSYLLAHALIVICNLVKHLILRALF